MAKSKAISRPEQLEQMKVVAVMFPSNGSPQDSQKGGVTGWRSPEQEVQRASGASWEVASWGELQPGQRRGKMRVRRGFAALMAIADGGLAKSGAARRVEKTQRRGGLIAGRSG